MTNGNDATVTSLSSTLHEHRAGGRLLFVDNLRSWAISLVVLIHVCEVFNPWDEWHINNGVRSRLIGEVVLIMAPYIMPIVMLLAGVSAWYSLSRRSNRVYIKERAVRVLMPLVVGTLVLVPPQVYLERILKGQFHGSFIQFYPHFFEGIYPNGNLSWHHLWFLAHLFIYSIVALPLFRFLQQKRGGRALNWLAHVVSGPGGILWLAVPLILERNLLWSIFPERHMLTSDWANHALLFVAYIYGFILAGQAWMRRAIDEEWPRMLAVACTGTISLMVMMWFGIIPKDLGADYSLTYLAFWTLYALCAWAWMVSLLGIGRKWLDRDGPILRYARGSGYAWYVLHQPIVVGFAYILVQSQMSLLMKFITLLVLSSAGTLASTEILRRLPIICNALGLQPPLKAVTEQKAA